MGACLLLVIQIEVQLQKAQRDFYTHRFRDTTQVRTVSLQILHITPLLLIRNHSIAHWQNKEHNQDPYNHDLYEVSVNIIQTESI